MISKGDIYWVKANTDITHPHAVIEVDGDKVTLCAITTNMKKAHLPGNVILDIGEANLNKQSIVDVADSITVPENKLGEYIGSLSEGRVDEVIAGVAFINKLIKYQT